MSTIKLYNTMSRKVEDFTPLNAPNVTMYVCGVTPYDTSHLGHAFVYIFFDALNRFLKYKGYKVTYVQNVTDIDEPLLERARDLHVGWQDLVNKWTNYLLHDFDFLNIAMPDHYVKATQEVEQMIKIIQGLLDKGYAYHSGGNIYFEIAKFPSYGSLAKLSHEQMIKTSVEMGNNIKDPNKKDPLDFPLWIKAEDPSWDSPWGKGRPGWHIECTAMSTKYLGQQIDIHGGGTDLIYPHHESEIAQAEGYSGKHPFVQHWMHSAMVAYQGTKMSKSLGNLVYVQDLAKKYSANAIRYFLFSHHYRQDWEFFMEDMEKQAEKYKKLEEKTGGKFLQDITEISPEFEQALSTDMNIPQAFEVLHASNDPEIIRSGLSLLGFK